MQARYNIPIVGHALANDFCILAKSKTYVHKETGALVRIASFNESSVWVIREDGTKTAYNYARVFIDLFSPFTDPHNVLCAHCGFLEVAHGDNLCVNCQGTGSV